MIIIALEGENMVQKQQQQNTYLNQNKLYIRLFFKKIKRFLSVCLHMLN